MALTTSAVVVLLEMAASTSSAVVVVLVLLAWAAGEAVVFAAGVAVVFVPVWLATMAGIVAVALVAMLVGAAIVAFPTSSLYWSMALSSVASGWVTTTAVVLPLGL